MADFSTDMTTKGITTLNWAIYPEPSPGHWAWTGGQSYFLWPSPLDYDASFANAGFSEFADTDDQWDRDLAQMTLQLASFLSSQKGPPRFLRGSEDAQNNLFHSTTPQLVLQEELLRSFHDRTKCLIVFGEPFNACVGIEGGQLWELMLPSHDDGFVLSLAGQMAGGRVIRRVELDWDKYFGSLH